MSGRCIPGGLYALLTVKALTPLSITWAFYLALSPTSGHILHREHGYECKAEDVVNLSGEGLSVLLALVGRVARNQSHVTSPVCYADELEFEHVILDNMAKSVSGMHGTDENWWIGVMELLRKDGTYMHFEDLKALIDNVRGIAVEAARKGKPMTVINEAV